MSWFTLILLGIVVLGVALWAWHAWQDARHDLPEQDKLDRRIQRQRTYNTAMISAAVMFLGWIGNAVVDQGKSSSATVEHLMSIEGKIGDIKRSEINTAAAVLDLDRRIVNGDKKDIEHEHRLLDHERRLNAADKRLDSIESRLQRRFRQ